MQSSETKEADARADTGLQAAADGFPSEKEKQGLHLDHEEILHSRQGYRFVRRIRDVICSLLALIVLAVPMLVIALVIWLDSPGASPVFAQERVGWNGKIFKLYKFRTMIPDAENKLHEVLHRNEMDGPVFKVKDDPRVTRVGRLLRKTSIDELPQLINVLKGDMSLVGPRPALPREVAAYNDYQKQRLYVMPGLTCYWQVQPHRNQIPFDQWVNLDLQYIQDRSFWLDWKLILETFVAIFRMYGE